MSDKTITELDALTVSASTDSLVVYDASATGTLKLTVANLINKLPTWLGFADTVTTMAADALAVPITASICHKTSGGDAETLTIVAGSSGQVLIIVMIVDGGGTGTIAASSSVADTIAFADAEDTAQLLFTNSKWHFMGGTATVS